MVLTGLILMKDTYKSNFLLFTDDRFSMLLTGLVLINDTYKSYLLLFADDRFSEILLCAKDVYDSLNE